MRARAGELLIDAEALVCGHGPAGFRLTVPRFQLHRGKALALVGPSGSGKTTLLHTLAGVLPARAGRLTVLDAPLATPDAQPFPDAAARRLRLERIGLVFQDLELLEHLDVRQNLMLAWHLGARPCPFAVGLARAERLGASLGLTPHLDRRPRVLSQGERQRVAVARALAVEPALLLADEPTGNLDAENARNVLDLLLEPVRERDAALLLVTHDPALLGAVDRVVELPRLAGGLA